MFEIRRYSQEYAEEWNLFVAQSKNGTFLFDRHYMDYHADRFEDYSLMFYLDNRLFALLPANRKDHILYSHQGLTYGGLVMDEHCRTAQVCELFKQLNAFLKSTGFQQVIYKYKPFVYTQLPSEEDLFALTDVCHSSILSRTVSSVVDLFHPLAFAELRRRGVKKAVDYQLRVEESTDYAAFWQVLTDNLQQKYHAHPIHSLAEIMMLHERFPHNIRLFVVRKDKQVVGGTVLYLSQHIVKTQYISANDDGKKMGALDLLFDSLLTKFASEGMHYFDFGTSNIPENNELNESLIHQKEGFGGRAVCYDTYSWTL
ncbi:MAG: GNAT family N-acetyltransferase [Prevotella sp.]|nr:GNAT family N-acetyltransferase [Prevotella sp.]